MNSTEMSPLIDFLLQSPRLPTKEALGDAVCELVDLALPDSQVLITTGGSTVLASKGLREEDVQALLNGSARPVSGPHPLGGGLVMHGYALGGVSEADYESVARIARAGVEHWRLEGARRIRRSWGGVTRAYIQALVSDIDEEEALELSVNSALEAGNSNLALLFLPGVGNGWTCEFAAGTDAQSFIGTTLELQDTVSATVLDGSAFSGHESSDLLSAPHQLVEKFGPICLVPLTIGGTVQGAMILLRNRGRLGYSQENLPLAESFGAAVSLAMELEQGRQAQSTATTLEERDRIGRDLHDLGIQLLFATGMQLDKLQAELEEGSYSKRRAAKGIREAMGSLEEAVKQIRQVVRGLKDTEQRLSFVEMLQMEASRSRQVLGFAPSLVIELDGVILSPDAPNWNEETKDLSARVPEDIADHAIATFREAVANAAKHSGARSVKISASVAGRGPVGELVLSVIDDGRGINPSRTRNSGIANMSARASERGGGFAVGLGPRGKGTAVVWRVPLG